MHVVQQEHALLRRGEEPLHLRGLDPRALEPALQPLAVLLGLQRAHHPGAHVGEALVVEVHRVLGGEDDPHPLRARLLEERQERPLGGRVRRVGREVAEDLVHVDERAQLGRPPLAAHPGLDLVEEESRHEDALLVGEVRGRDDREPRAPVGGAQHAVDVERLALPPARERGRGQQVVEGHHERLPVLARERGLEGQRADLVEGRLGHLPDEALEGEALPRAPAPLDQGGQEDGGRRLQRVGLDANEPEEAGHDGLDLVAQVLLGGLEGHGGRVERLQDVEGHPGPRARREDDRVVGLLQGRDVGGAEPPLGEALLPGRGRVGGRRLQVLALAARGLRVDPGLEGGGVERLEEEQEVREVALRIDREDGDALAQQLLEEDDGEAGLARARHADDEPVGQQVGGIEIQAVAESAAAGIDLLAEIEPVAHAAPPRRLFALPRKAV